MRVFCSLPLATQQFGLCPGDDMINEAWLPFLLMTHRPATALLDCTPVDIFGDGSCTDPTLPDYRVAAAAIVLAGKDRQSRVLHQRLLPGRDQSIVRAEILAGTLAIEKARHVVYFSDNAAFVSGACRRLLALRDGTVFPITDHQDVWNWFEEALIGRNPDDIKIVKVKAHLVVTPATPPYLAWCIFHNDKADSAAKAAINKQLLSAQLKIKHAKTRQGKIQYCLAAPCFSGGKRQDIH